MKSSLNYTYLLGFLFYFHAYLPLYINSSFLASLISEKNVGFIYALTSLLSMFSLILVPKLLEKVGNYRLTLTLLVFQTIFLVGLGVLKDPIFLLVLFILGQVGLGLIFFNLDNFIEKESSNIKTGRIRGLFLSIINIALLISPFLASLIVKDDSYQRVFIISGFLLLPVMILLLAKFRKFKDPKYDKLPFWKTARRVILNQNLKGVFVAQFILRLFYAVMVIYSPIYLHEIIGFEWRDIGIIFTIMLLPFVLFELPVGELADKKYGEKEMMSLGFLIMGLSVMLLYVPWTNSIFLWAILLFITRTGASIVEITSETYFFKKIDSSDSDLISFFRILGPLSFLVGPLIAFPVLFLANLQSLFIAIGLLNLCGIFYSLRLKDTR